MGTAKKTSMKAKAVQRASDTLVVNGCAITRENVIKAIDYAREAGVFVDR